MWVVIGLAMCLGGFAVARSSVQDVIKYLFCWDSVVGLIRRWTDNVVARNRPPTTPGWLQAVIADRTTPNQGTQLQVGSSVVPEDTGVMQGKQQSHKQPSFLMQSLIHPSVLDDEPWDERSRTEPSSEDPEVANSEHPNSTRDPRVPRPSVNRTKYECPV